MVSLRKSKRRIVLRENNEIKEISEISNRKKSHSVKFLLMCSLKEYRSNYSLQDKLRLPHHAV